jgi:hypothetical protein
VSELERERELAKALQAQARLKLQMHQSQQPAPAMGPSGAPADMGAGGNSAAGLLGQFGAGTQSGIANVAGFPVDAVTGVINAVGQGTGLYDPIEKPFLGSQSISGMLEPFRAGVPEPSTRAERMTRRVGEEAGASAVLLPAALASIPAAMARPGATAMAEGASSLGSGLGAGVAGEVAPGSGIAEIAGALAGGITGGGIAGRLLDMGGRGANVVSGIEDQRARAAELYGNVRADQRVLPQSSVQGLAGDISARMDAERINPRLQPGSSAIADALVSDASRPSRIEDIENMRRLTTRALPATASPDDRRLSQIMQDQITDYLGNLDDPIAGQLTEARDAYRRSSAASDIAAATDKAALRAASTGSGGNEINAVRQNLRRILDTPRLARSFKPDELAAIREIVEGTADQNVMRRLSRFAPSSGGLASMLGIGGTLASPEVALPIMALTEGAKALGERSTRQSIASLLQQLAPDRVLAPSQMGADAVVRALMASRLVANDE